MRSHLRCATVISAVLVYTTVASGGADAQTLYDYSVRTQGSDIFAYDGESTQQVPSNATSPATVLSSADYDDIEFDDSASHSHSASGLFSYPQIRFAIDIDESPASLASLEATWTGRGDNSFFLLSDGAGLYIWNYATGSYELLADSGNTSAEVTISGAVSTNPADYLGGGSGKTVTLLAVTRASRFLFSSVTLQTDYVKLDVTTSVSAVDHFVIGHDGAGIHCLAESLTVTAVDSAGNPVTDYGGTITLDTTTTNGTWTEAPANGGSFSDPTPDDGLATYQFDPADNGVASFFLSYTNGTAGFDIETFQSDDTGIRDDDTEGPMAFAPSGFTVTASALANPPPNPINDPVANQTAGTDFALHLAAYGQTPTDPTCGVIESYTGDHDLKFWSTYSDPGSGGVAVGVDLNPIATAEGLATSQTVSFSAGRAVVTAKYKDVGRILVSMKDDTVSEPAAGIRGASNPFVVKPADFFITAITRLDLSANPGATSPAGDVFVAAGDPFRVTLEVRDAEGTRTPNYGNESSAEGILLSPATLVEPSGGQSGSVGSPISFTAAAPAGTFVSTAVSWSEVGATTLRASVGDGDYLLAGDVTGSESVTVGRFTPSRFAVSPNAPRFATSCDIGGFSYQGAPLAFDVAPVLTVTAQNAAGGTTQNYAGPTWWRLTNASLTGRSYQSEPGSPALDESDLPLTTADPVIAQSGNGVGTLTFSTGGGLRFTRGAPVAPFDAEISLEIDVVDLDGIANPANPATFGSPTPAGGIAFSAGKLTRFGRLVLANAHDSELVTVPVPLRTEIFDGASWVASTDDSCSSIDTADLVQAPSPPALSTTPSIANDPLLFGDAGLAFSAPGAGNTGHVDVAVDLSEGTGADLEWLRFDWPSDGNLDGVPDDDPNGRVTFGIYPGRPDVIFLREVY